MSVAGELKLTPRTPQIWPLSVQAYHTLGDLGLIPESTELLHGQIFHKMAKSPPHTLLLMRLFEPLRKALPPGVHVRQEQPITCDDSEPEPDLAVVQGSVEDYGAEHPRTAGLVIEVCVSSVEYDRFKLPAYARAGVKEVWLILAPEKQIEVYRRPDGEQFRERLVHGPGGRLASAAVPRFEVELDELFKESPQRKAEDD